jgi:hypothetical protein
MFAIRQQAASARDQKGGVTMAYPNPVPDGWYFDKQWKDGKPAAVPTLPATWTATVLLSPFGDSISPLPNFSQIAIGTIEYSYTADFAAMRTRLYNTQDLVYFDFLFVSDPNSAAWYWLDSTPNGPVKKVYGPFKTTLQVLAPTFLADNGAQWGNAYPLMKIDCNHFVVPTPGATEHGSWYAFRRDTGNPFRVFMMDSDNPLMIPVLGSYYIANLPSFTPGAISDETKAAIRQVQSGQTTARADYWNPLITQEDIHRAMAFPLASAKCTPDDLKAVIPGFAAVPAGVNPPVWSNQTYIEGWTLGTDFIPYWTRVCYLWTGDANSKQQSVFVGLGLTAGQGTYYQRSDTCLNMTGTTQPYYVFPTGGFGSWDCTLCQHHNPPVGLPKPDWLKLDGGRAMAQIVGNANFGLAQGEALNLFAGQLPRDVYGLAIFWLWFTGEGNGVLFTEGNYLHPRSHNLQLIDYTLFVQNAGITQSAFEAPCGWSPAAAQAKMSLAHGHLTDVGVASV